MWAFYRKFFVWEQRKLGDIVTFYRGLTYSPKNVHKTGTLVLRSSNVKNNVIINADNVYVDPKIVNSSNVKKGDLIVVVRNGSKSLLGKHAEVIRNMPNTVIGAFMTGIKTKHSNFVNALLSTELFKSEMHKNMGSTINQITGHIFSNMTFNFPKNKEQNKTGNLFKIINKILFLQERKTALTKRIYLGILQKLFSNYSLKKYKRYKLKDVSISKKGKEIKKNEIFKTGKYAVVHYADLYKFYPVQKNAIHFSNKKLGILIPNNSLLFPGSDVTPSGLARTSTILQKNVFAGNDVIIFCLNENRVSAQFLSYELNFLKEEILSLITGTTIKHIYIKDLENMDIFLPSMKVQKLIENVLNKITYKRISNKNIIFQLSKFKQFLLQNMFI